MTRSRNGRREEVREEEALCETIGNDNLIMDSNSKDTDAGNVVHQENLQMIGTPSETVDRITNNEAAEFRTDDGVTKRGQRKDGSQFKVACNIYNKQMMRASVVRHASNGHHLHGEWKEVSQRVENADEGEMEDNNRSFSLLP